ncbi:trihelix transcription factor ASIL2-like [Cynara cardunculus var. scolymus]|uniref:MADF domain-containing protein n=1 Tax=Cynara cardunculus var. scolymus TaxID=59895 RepID=A0A103Y114_CYNCS|nr:trihelix transcription factor ASIL2-like [Cynara cardunculus var. scolymus]KVI00549.1 MADF domain-containing protein [Cynara cardunculus var. scolymus]
MASSNSPSSPQEPSNALVAQQPTSTAASRRLPPPCWSHDETVALIDAYRDKWYSLRRGNLRASHWQEVADGVAARCPLGNPPKTSIQCRHKMEKLRKRYRAEIQRIGNTPRGHRYPSSWVHFKRMDSMELGSSSSDPSVDPINQDEEEEDGRGDENEDDLLLYPKGIKQAIALPLNRRYQGSIGNGNGNGNGNGVRIKIPNIAAVPPPPPSALNLYNSNRSFDDYPPSMNPHYGSGKGSRDGYMKEAFGTEKDRNVGGGGGMKRREDMENNGSHLMDEMVAAIQKLGDGFVKMERMKMDMARELESMRMKMEMKRTEMILESQQRLVDSFSKTVMEKKNKKIKRMPTPES